MPFPNLDGRPVNNHKIHLELHEQFYSTGLLDPGRLMLDYRKYRGKGRPRKSDYSPFIEIQKYLNEIRNRHIEEHKRLLK
jgi:hypothetical protein